MKAVSGFTIFLVTTSPATPVIYSIKFLVFNFLDFLAPNIGHRCENQPVLGLGGLGEEEDAVSLYPSHVKVLCKATIPISPIDFSRMFFLRNQTRNSSRINKNITLLNVPNMFKINIKDIRTTLIDVIMMSLLLILNRFNLFI